jgi:hypothetical protein
MCVMELQSVLCAERIGCFSVTQLNCKSGEKGHVMGTP